MDNFTLLTSVVAAAVRGFRAQVVNSQLELQGVFLNWPPRTMSLYWPPPIFLSVTRYLDVFDHEGGASLGL